MPDSGEGTGTDQSTLWPILWRNLNASQETVDARQADYRAAFSFYRGFNTAVIHHPFRYSALRHRSAIRQKAAFANGHRLTHWKPLVLVT